MKSRYQGLRTFGTLALIIAWLLLILGILAAIGTWLGISSLTKALDVQGGGWSIAAALPPLFFSLLGFIQFYIIGKVLRLLVDLDETTLDMHDKVQQAGGPAAAADSGADISGELKRSANLIAANLEATQSLQQQVTSLDGKLGALRAPAAVAAPVVAAGQQAVETIAAESIE